MSIGGGCTRGEPSLRAGDDDGTDAGRRDLGRNRFTGFYELPLTRRLVQLAKRGGLMVEIGANLGYFSLLWVAAHPSNRSIAFEAAPRNIEMIRRNITRNGMENQVDVIPCAAGAANERRPFDVGPPEQTGSGGFAPSSDAGLIDVQVIRVDEVVSTTQRIALLKVDAEGADTRALMGCGRLLRARAIEEIWYEQNKPRMQALGVPLRATEGYLRQLGYTAAPQSDPTADVVEWCAMPSASNVAREADQRRGG